MSDYKPKVARKGAGKPKRGMKPYQKKVSNSRRLRDVDEETGKPIANDSNWYFTDATLAEQVTRFSFNQFLGVPFTLSPNNEIPSEIKIPTIAQFYLNPSAGWTDAGAPQRAGINTAGFKLYTLLSSRNAKTTSYAPQDVTVLLLALGEVICYTSWLTRFFGLTTTYNVRNRAYARYICEIQGLNFTDFVANRADYLIRFNYLMNMINRIPFPANISYFSKCRSLFTDIYTDAESAMAQSYVFTPFSTWIFDEAYSTDGSGLRTTLIPHNMGAVAFSRYLDILQEMIEALLNSTTLNYVYSDVLSYAEKNSVPLLAMSIIPSDYSIIPQYSAAIKLQIKNATILGTPLPQNAMYDDGMHFTVDNDVKSDANLNCIRYTPQFSAGRAIMGLEAILDFPYDNPDVTNIVEATRFTVRAQAVLNEGNYYTNQISLCDRYITRLSIYTTNGDAAANITSSWLGQVSTTNYYYLELMSHFSSMPYVYRADSQSVFNGLYGDTTYFTTVGEKYLTRVADICMQGLFELR